MPCALPAHLPGVPCSPLPRLVPKLRPFTEVHWLDLCSPEGPLQQRQGHRTGFFSQEVATGLLSPLHVSRPHQVLRVLHTLCLILTANGRVDASPVLKARKSKVPEALRRPRGRPVVDDRRWHAACRLSQLCSFCSTFVRVRRTDGSSSF